MHCPISGINIPRFLLSVIISFAFVFGLEFVIHGTFLMDIYKETANLWRSEEEMTAFYPLSMIRTLLLVTIPAYIYTRNHEGKGIMEGLRFGIPLALLLAVMDGAAYIWMPIPLELALAWSGTGLLTGLSLGIIYSLTYKK